MSSYELLARETERNFLEHARPQINSDVLIRRESYAPANTQRDNVSSTCNRKLLSAELHNGKIVPALPSLDDSLLRDFRSAVHVTDIDAISAVLELANGPKSSLTFRGKTGAEIEAYTYIHSQRARQRNRYNDARESVMSVLNHWYRRVFDAQSTVK